MSEELIKKIKDLQHHHDIKQLLKGLLHILSNDWIKGLTSLKRSQALINKFGDPKRGHDITEIIKALIKAIPKKYKNRYRKYFLSIIPLNDLLQELSQKVTKSDFWLLDKEICVTSLLARFEAVYAHIDNNVQTQLEDRLQTQKMLHMRKPLFLRADDGSFVGVEKNRSNIRSRNSSGTPEPESRTLKMTSEVVRYSSTSIVPPGVLNFNALSNKLLTI